MFTALHNFCAIDLSAFYFDVRKDSLYCDNPRDKRRRATRTVLDLTFDYLVRWLAPVLCFTAEEAWLARHGDDEAVSVHLERYREAPSSWRDDALCEKWGRIRDLRRVVTGAIELERAQKRLGSSLQAAVEVYLDKRRAEDFNGLDPAEIFITSAATLRLDTPPEGSFILPDLPGIGVRVSLAQGEKCQRCWRVLPEVGDNPTHPDLCGRCAEAVDASGMVLV